MAVSRRLSNRSVSAPSTVADHEAREVLQKGKMIVRGPCSSTSRSNGLIVCRLSSDMEIIWPPMYVTAGR